MTTNLFNPFAIFGCKVQRRFLIRPREYSNYTETQLYEEVEHELRIFIINKVVWFLGKDVTSFLGITPNNSSRIIKKIDQHYVVQEKVNITGAAVTSKRCKQITTKMYLVNEPGIYALIQKSRTAYAEIFKTWLNNIIAPKLANMILAQNEIDQLRDAMKNVDISIDGYIYCVKPKFFQTNHYKIGKTKKLQNLHCYSRPYGKFEVVIFKYVSDRHKAEITIHKHLKPYLTDGEIFNCEIDTIKSFFDSVD